MYDNLPEELNIKVQRAARNVITISKSGDYTGLIIKNVVKSVKGKAGQQLLEKTNSAGIDVLYENGTSTFTLTYEPADFVNLDKTNYYHSISAVDPDDADNFIFLWQGDFILNPNVEDPLDDIPGELSAVYVIDISALNIDDMFKVALIANKKVLVNVSLAQRKNELGIIELLNRVSLLEANSGNSSFNESTYIFI